eukprot:TRINITY_DN4284_c0_g2_i1.p1 TRINITY_DN4284_c0_g2~~TRINITY_DN4284_c0_g2_i1.p1  ORF type:complete len:621 (+),score=230.09 TRINITY_DN4284_c0_g2_i1:44-1906(+)
MPLNLIDYEKSQNLFVQAMKGTSLGITLRKINEPRWAVLVPQSVILDEMGLAVVSNDFLKTHTVIFNTTGNPSDKTFTTLNGLKGIFISSGSSSDVGGDTIVMELPADGLQQSATPLGPLPTDQGSPTTPGGTRQQTIQILRQTELEVDTTDGFTIPIYLVSDVIRAKWLTGDPLESIGWHSEKQQEPREGSTAPTHLNIPQPAPTPVPASKSPLKPQGSTPTPPRPGPPKFRFRDFAEKMRQPKAADLHKKLKAFVAETKNNVVPPEDMPEVVQAFLANMFNEIKQNPVWKGASEQELDFAQEGLEKYVLTKIFSKTFGTAEDLKKDEVLEKRLASFKFISPEHLEVRPEILDHPTWKEAVQELQKLNEYKNPRDKLICITNSCKLIFSVLHSLEPGKSMGADDFLPCLILLVGKADAKHLHSNTNFIQNYRNESKMSSEAGYYFCTLQSAIHFWETADADSLKISQAQLEEINAGLADKPKPDFNDVQIDEEDNWDMDKSLARKASIAAPSGTNLLTGVVASDCDSRSPEPSPTMGSVTDNALDALFAQHTHAHDTTQPLTDSDIALKEQLTEILQTTTPVPIPSSPGDLQAAHLQSLYNEWQRLTRLYNSVSELVKI